MHAQQDFPVVERASSSQPQSTVMQGDDICVDLPDCCMQELENLLNEGAQCFGDMAGLC